MNIDYALIGARIKAKRKERLMTQEMMAEALDVSVGYVSQVERGVTKISLDLLAEISSILDCDISVFVSGTAVSGENYLKSELSDKFDMLPARDKKLVLGMIEMMMQMQQ